MRSDARGGGPMLDDIDLIADLNAENDDGLGWSLLADARAATG